MQAIPLTQGKTALVDDSDGAAVLAHRWRAAFIVDRWYDIAELFGMTAHELASILLGTGLGQTA